MDSYGKFNELYDFSSCLIDKGIKVVKARAEGRFDFGNIPKAAPDAAYLILRACDKGQPILNGDNIEVNGKSYSIKNNLNNYDKSPESFTDSELLLPMIISE